jgi:hypothetical protein
MYYGKLSVGPGGICRVSLLVYGEFENLAGSKDGEVIVSRAKQSCTTHAGEIQSGVACYRVCMCDSPSGSGCKAVERADSGVVEVS